MKVRLSEPNTCLSTWTEPRERGGLALKASRTRHGDYGNGAFVFEALMPSVATANSPEPLAVLFFVPHSIAFRFGCALLHNINGLLAFSLV